MPTDFFEKMGTVKCPKCGEENEFDIDNDGIVCEECGAILMINEYSDEDGYTAYVA